MAESFDDLNFELIPAGRGGLSPDEQLQAALGTLDIGVDAEEGRTVTPSYGRGWAFDFLEGRFVRQGAAPVEVTGLDHLRVWIEKTIRTERYSSPIYSDDYGTEMPDIIGSTYSASDLSTLADAIRDALVVHDRIAEVEDFEFELDEDDAEILLVSFTVVTDTEETLLIDSIPVV